MIRYQITSDELKKRITAHSGTWLTRAKERTEEFRDLKKYSEKSSIWGEIKKIYMELQNFKCAYCEQRLGDKNYGSIVNDMEHFRPKKAVDKWPTRKIAEERNLKYSFSTGERSDNGYYLLAYDIFNYAASCKICNTTMKGNYFPVAGERDIAGEDVSLLGKKEEPFLIYPLGDIDEDPEDLLTFLGTVPMPKYKDGYQNLRARITIDLFALDIREDLIRGRFAAIQLLWHLLEKRHNLQESQDIRDTNEDISIRLSSKTEHANCSRAFYVLYKSDSDRKLARKIYFLARDYNNLSHLEDLSPK